MTQREQKLIEFLDENLTIDELQYLTVVCNTRNKATAAKAKKLLRNGNLGAAIKCADPIRFNQLLNEKNDSI